MFSQIVDSFSRLYNGPRLHQNELNWLGLLISTYLLEPLSILNQVSSGVSLVSQSFKKYA